MPASTWNWIGGSATETIASDWTLIAGPGNANGFPTSGDTGIDTAGMIILPFDDTFVENLLELGGTGGAVATLSTAGDGSITSGNGSVTFSNPTFDSNTVLTSAVPGQSTAETSVLDAAGTFVNQGTILADGPSGSTFTIDTSATSVSGTTAPGYFYNPSVIQADAGNTLTINIGATSEMFNSGTILADGGTVKVAVNPSAIAGGDGPVRGFEEIAGGGTLETAASYPASDGNNGSHAEIDFIDSTPGNTLKIDNIGSFGGVILGFTAGDTIDLGTLLAVGTVAWDPATGFMSLEAANATTLATMLVGNIGTGYAAGSFAVTNGTADGLTIGVGADGDTVLTTGLTRLSTSGTSGAWQSATSWAGGIIPGTSSSASIGVGATAPFTLTTGGAPVSVSGFGISSPLATVQITSDTTLTNASNTGQVSDYFGTLDIAAGATLTGGAIQMYAPTASFTIAAGATADLVGRPNTDLGPQNGIWTTQPGQNPFAFSVSAGTAEVSGAILAGPTGSTRGGSTGIGYESAGAPAVMIVNPGATVTDTHTTMGSDPTSAGTLTIDDATWTDMIDPQDTYSSRGNMNVGYDDVALNTPAGTPPPQEIAPAVLTIENNSVVTEQQGAQVANTEDSAGEVTVETGALWNIGTPGNGYGLGLGYGANASGTLSVLNGGTVAIYGGGTYLSNGTTVASAGGIGVGKSLGSNGTIIVSGPGSELSSTDGMGVGQSGQGLLSIVNGGTVLIAGNGMGTGQTVAAGSSGTIDVGGSGAPAALDFLPASGSVAAAGGLTVGSATQGTMIVSDNGTVNLNGTTYLTVGSTAGAVGTVVVGGTTASAVINIGVDGLTDGFNGTGFVTVNSLGTINLTGTAGITVGQNVGSTGSLTINGGNVTESSSSNGVGVGSNSGAANSILVENDGTMALAGGWLTAGANSGANGAVTIQGSGSSLKMSGTAGVTAGLNAGSNGTLSVNSGGSLGIVGTGAINVALDSGSTGQMIVSGGLVTLAASTQGIFVGSSGSGTLTVNNDGTVSDGAVLALGNGGNGNAQALVTLNGGAISAASADIGIYNLSSGTVNVTTGTLTTTGTVILGIYGGSSGTVTVAGSGSAMEIPTSGNTAQIVVGQSGKGTLAVSAGGTINSASDLQIGLDNGSSGTVTVTGANSTFRAGFGMTVGVAGSGTLAASNGATLSTTGFGVGGYVTGPQGAAANRASFTTGAELQATANIAVWAGSTLSVDSTSGIDAGTSGDYVPGAINLEAGNTLTGNGLIAAAVVNDGLIDASSASVPGPANYNGLEIQGAITGSGGLQIGNSGILRLDAAVPAGQAIKFGTGSELILNTPGSGLTNAISGLSAGDRIEFNFGPGVSITNVNYTDSGPSFIPMVTITTTAGSYVMTNVSFAGPSSNSFYWGTDSATGDQSVQVAPSNFNWTGTGGDTLYSDNNNWQGDLAPNISETANFFSNPGTITGTGGALQLNFGSYDTAYYGTWTLAGADLTVAGAPNAPYSPFALGFYANVVLNGGTLNAGGGSANIGNVNGITVTAEGGAQVTTQGDGVGTNSGQAGSLVLTGVGTTWNELSGAAQNGNTGGYLSVGGGGPANGQSGSAGYLTVTGGAVLNTGGGVGVGGSAGSLGSVTISAGGTWTASNGLQIGQSGSGTLSVTGGSVNTSSYNAIGANTGGYGTVAVSAGGIFNAGSYLAVGQSGDGVLSISGGTVSTPNGIGIATNIGGQGSVSLSAGLLSVGTGLGVGNLGAGTLAVTGGTVTAAEGFSLGGNAGAIGIATLTGGLITAAGGIQVGQSGDGTLTVGAGGTLQFAGTFNPVGSNSGSDGTLQILGGGTAVATQAASQSTVMEIGNSGTSGTLTAAAGNVLVSGAGSLLNLNGNGMLVGANGDGNLTVSGGGTVEAGVQNSNSASALQSGNTIGSMGSILVTGAGSALDLAGFVLVGRGGSSNLTVSNNGQMNITASPSATSGMQIGVGNPSNSLALGGNGEATVESGGTLSVNSNGITIGGEGASGVLNVNGGGLVSTLTGLSVGVANTTNGTVYGGTGALNIGAGGTVLVIEPQQTTSVALQIGINGSNNTSPTALANGEVTVSGAGALLNTNGNGIEIGRSGIGGLTVSQGATVLAGDPNANFIVGLAIGRVGTGSMVLTDIGSSATVAGFAFVGRGGSGSLQIQNHATMVVSNDPTGLQANGSGGLNVGFGNGSGGSTQTSMQAGGAGDLQVTSSGSLFVTQVFAVGGNDASGSVEINTGGAIEAGTTVSIGTSDTLAAGGTLVTTSGTTVVASAQLMVGHGIITVGAGGLLKADGTGITAALTPDIVIGKWTAATGIMDVTGADATVDSNGYEIAVGSATQGSLLISQGGTVLAGTPFAADEAIVLGVTTGGSGSLTLSDPGSVLQAKGQLSVGLSGLGTLLIENQATATTGNNAVDTAEGFEIGQNAGASGNATVTGSKSLLSNTGRFVVGDGGFGNLAISGGATVITTPGSVADLAGLVVAATAAASGSSVNASGTGSQLSVTGLLQVGAGGAGSLLLNNGAAATATSLDAGVSAAASGNVSLSGTNTSLKLTGAAIIGDAGTGVLSVLGGATLSTDDLTAGAQGAGSGLVTVGGGGVLTIANGGSIQLGDGSGSSGSLIVSNGGTVIGNAITLTGSGSVGIATGAELTGDVIATASGETLENLGTLTGGVTLAGGDTLITGGGAVFAGGITGGGGNTLEISSGPFALTNFDATGQVQYSALRIDAGATVTTDSSDVWDGQIVTVAGTLINGATLSNGVTLTAQGVLNNLAGNTVSGGVTATAVGETVSNLGTVTGPVSLAGGDRVVTGAGAVFSGGITGGTGGNTLEIASGPYTLTNFDAAGSPQYAMLQIDAGVIVTVDTTDVLTGATLINGGTLDLGAFEATSSLQNSGEITGAITLASGVPLTNSPGGTISGTGLAVIEALGPASVMNSGVIDPSPIGVDMMAGGSFTNAAGATTEGTDIGVQITGGAGTITNAGTITGDTGDAVTLAAGFANRVIVDPGAVFKGVVDGGNPVGTSPASTLELASGPSAATGTLIGFGTEFTNFAQIQLDPGATWSFAGSNSLAAGTTLTDQGTMQLTGATATGGAITINGTAASWTVSGGVWSGMTQLTADGASGGSLLVDNAGTAGAAGVEVAASTGGTGTIAVAGAHSVLSDSGSMTVGDAGSGSLFIAAGGTVISASGAVIANTATSSSLASLSGAGSNWQVTGSLVVGNAGNGSLTLDQGTTVNAASLILAATAGSGGVVTATGAGTSLGVSGSTTIGNEGGVLLILSGAAANFGTTLDDQDQMILGDATASGGAVTVAGAAGVTASGTVTAGVWSGITQLTIGGAGAGSFLVDNTGSASAGGVDLAANTGGSGTLTVTGVNSLLSNSGSFTVGDAGAGSLSIQAGGTVTTSAGAVIANTGSASGSSVNVSGAGSNWQVGGALAVGAAGFGQLSVSQAGSVGAGSVDLGSAASGSAVLSISGADSILNVTGLVTIGDQSGATVSLLQDGSLFANDLNVGTGNGIGELVIDGTPAGGFQFDQSGDVLNPALSVANDMTVGANGVFSLGANEVVHIANNFVIAGPVIQGAGSQIDPSTVTNTVKTGGGSGASQTGSTKIVNNSTYYAGEDKNGTFILNTPSLTGTGVLEVGQLTLNTAGAPGNLVLNAGVVDATQTVNFVGGPGTLTLGTNAAVDAIAGFHATIDSFNSNDTIVVDTAAAATFVPVGSIVTVSTGGSLTFASAALALTATTTQGALVDQVVPCYAAGTLIETVAGPVAVEELRVGDEVRTLLGGPGRIVWVGSRAVDCARHRRPETVWPVRIERGAFAENVPARDLFVSPDHAIYVDGVLIPAKLLINGTSITQVKRSKIAYYHVELGRHEVILAEGLPAESYLDTGDRANFDGGETIRLFPDLAARLAPDTGMLWETRGAAALVMMGQALARTRRLVDARVSRQACRSGAKTASGSRRPSGRLG